VSALEVLAGALEPRARFRTSGGDLSYTDVGDGPAVLLLHGFPLWSYEWREFIPLFSSRFRVIAPDLLGSGDSEKPDDAPLDVRAQAGYVRELLATLGVDRYAVVGHGPGGVVAQLLALDGHGVEALVLLDAAASDRWPSGRTRGATEGPRTAERSAAIVRATIEEGVAAGAKIPEGVVEAYVAPFAAAADPFFRVRDAIDDRALAGREVELERIAFPVLILWGEDDPFFPSHEAERLNEAMPSSALGLLPGCGHFLVDEAAATIAPMISEYLRARWLHAPHGHGDTSGVVMLQLERRPPWVDLAEAEADDWFDAGAEGPRVPDPADQEIGRDAAR
jgi:pimeloyl-ACP methyl ester carboxylesterase